MKIAMLVPGLGAVMTAITAAAVAAGPDAGGATNLEPTVLAQAGEGGKGGPPPAVREMKPRGGGEAERDAQMNDSAPPRSAPPASIIGAHVVDVEGKKIAEVTGIDGNRVVMSVGGFLGIGARDVAVSWDRLTLSETENRRELLTTMSQEQLEKLPEYDGPDAAAGGSSKNTRGSTPQR